MKTSNEISKITPALIKAQKTIKHAIKDAKNPHFRNDYATLESVIDATKEALLSVGIIVVQAHTVENNLVTTLIHESGEFLSSVVPLMMKSNDMQQLGSATTYARRYAIASMLNISQEDDDGNVASQPVKEEKKTFTPTPKPAPKTAEVKTEPVAEKAMQNPGDFVILIGKNSGKKISDLPPEQVDAGIGYWQKIAKDNNSPLVGNPKGFVENGIKHLINIGFYPPTKEQ